MAGDFRILGVFEHNVQDFHHRLEVGVGDILCVTNVEYPLKHRIKVGDRIASKGMSGVVGEFALGFLGVRPNPFVDNLHVLIVHLDSSFSFCYDQSISQRSVKMKELLAKIWREARQFWYYQFADTDDRLCWLIARENIVAGEDSELPRP